MHREPALIVGVVVALLIAIAARWNIVLDEAGTTAIVAPFVTAIVARFFVSPAR